ncbi:hypothetical protein BGX26_007711, partial [Mortierella sp. AD094]
MAANKVNAICLQLEKNKRPNYLLPINESSDFVIKRKSASEITTRDQHTSTGKRKAEQEAWTLRKRHQTCESKANSRSNSSWQSKDDEEEDDEEEGGRGGGGGVLVSIALVMKIKAEDGKDYNSKEFEIQGTRSKNLPVRIVVPRRAENNGDFHPAYLLAGAGQGSVEDIPPYGVPLYQD